jgi:hypothetical protein
MDISVLGTQRFIPDAQSSDAAVSHAGGDVHTHRYRIRISGSLGEIGREAFADFRIESNGADTVLVGDLDQAALYGTLNRILTLGLELLELTRLTDPPPA